MMSETWTFRAYRGEDAAMWNERNAASRNGTFLFDRRYMDYHNDRFSDASLIALRGGKPMAMLPADRTAEGVLRSHGGLTYGGWILPPAHMDGSDVLAMFEAWLEFERSRQTRSIVYKPMPHIYHRRPSEDDLYALFRVGARLDTCAISTTIRLADRGDYNTLRRRTLRKALRLSPVIEQSADIEGYWRLLSDCLAERHAVAPVHSASELQLLCSRFPDNMRLYTASVEGEMHAGVLMFMTDTVAHAQYIATSSFGREHGLLTPLFDRLMALAAEQGKAYFDFGISTERGGEYLNEGLLRQKTSFGGSPTVYNSYVIDL